MTRDNDYKKPDYWAQRAKKEGFAARSVFKLEEIDGKENLLRPGLRVVDLGAAPGSWMQYIGKAVGSKGIVVGVDLKALDRELKPNERFHQADIHQLDPRLLLEHAPRYDLVLSDMMPNTIGHKKSDSLRSIVVAERALFFAQTLLRPGGNFIVKVFQGAEFDSFRKMLMQTFDKVKVKKPQSSRKTSREVYLVALSKKET